MIKTTIRTISLILAAAAATLLLTSSAEQERSSFTIHLIGDSTMAPKDLSGGNPERGWGMMFPNFLDDSVKVINYARNGRSTKSFMTLGHWAKVEANLQKGDYLFIQFGHNDSKQSDTTRYAAAWGAYQDNLRHYIKVAREKGATPVLLTPVSRRWFKADTLDETCLEDYPEAMKQVAEQESVTLLDITKVTMDWLKSLGDTASREYFMWVAPGTVPTMPEGKTDNTHTNAKGARKVAGLVCGEIAKLLPEIARHFVYYDIVVAQDGTGDYFTVQEAIDACPDYSHEEITTILIRNGVYNEMVTIPHNKFRLHIIGESADSTVMGLQRRHIGQRRILHPLLLRDLREPHDTQPRRRRQGDRPGSGPLHQRRPPLLQELPHHRQPGHHLHLRTLEQGRRSLPQLLPELPTSRAPPTSSSAPPSLTSRTALSTARRTAT